MMFSNPLVVTLAGIGAVTVISIAYFTVDFLTFHLLKPSRPLEAYKRPGREPTYALITGASAGIGLGVAQELVRQGFGVILLGHLADELNEAAEMLRLMTPSSATAAVQTLVVDARTATPAEMEAAVRSIAHLQVAILVNNVGGNPVELPAFRQLSTHSMADVDAVVDMNARFMARLTALMLPLLSRKAGPKDRSLILSMSSGGMCGLPWLVMYGATKAFNWAFSCGLGRELATDAMTQHIDCLAIIPGEVRSQGNNQGVSENMPRWDQYGKCIVEKVDGALWRGRREMSPYWLHDLQYIILRNLPEGARTVGVLNSMAHKRDAFNAVYKKSY